MAINNETDISLKFTNKVTNLNKLEQYEKRLTNIKTILSKMPPSVTFNPDEIAKVEKSLNETSQTSNETKKNLSMAFRLSTITTFVYMLKKVSTVLGRVVNQSSSYLENINLYQVAFNGAYQEADKFVNKITEMYGLDESWAVRTVGIFRQLANAMGLAVEQADSLSYLMTQMSIDISSLYNVDIDRASQVLQSALAGQTRPIRGVTGADITQNTLQQTLNQLGIDRAISSLSFAEKRLIIIVSLTEQLKQSVNDFGRTIESPANQTRILNEQWERLTRAVGNVFLPIISKVLPYLNAILMVLTEIINTIASLFGYKQDDYDYFTGVADSVLDLEENLDGATESAKKLKQGLRGFDKLNVISTPTSASAGAGGGISPDIAKAYDEAYAEYMRKLKNVKMKATEIRDTIMEWLGFTKEIDEKTGKVSFKFDHITGGTVLGALAVGGTVFMGVKKIYDIIKKIGGFVGLFKDKGDKSKSIINSTGNIGNAINKNTKNFKIPNAKTILKGMADIGIIIGGTVAIIGAIGLVSKIPNVNEIMSSGVELLKIVFNGILNIAIPLAGMSAGIVVLGNIGISTIVKGLADMAIIIGGTTALITALGALISIPHFKDFANNGVDITVSVFKGLNKIFVPLVEMSALIIGLGIADPILIASGLAGLAIIIAGLEAIVVGLGALRSINGFDDLVSNGIDGLIILGTGIGKFFGSIIAGFIDVNLDFIDNIGTHLSNFIINAQPFFEGIAKIPESATKSAENVANCILIFTKASILDGLTRWFTGGIDLSKFGKDLAEFGKYFKQFGDNVTGLKSDVVENATNSALGISAFVDTLPKYGGLKQLWTGTADIVKFSEALPELGTNLKKFGDNASGLKNDVVENATKSANVISEFATNLPNQGGVVSWFTGDNTIDKFSKPLPQFGKDLKAFADNINGIDASIVEESGNSAKVLAEFANNLPNQGGIASWFSGDNTLGKFGKELKTFGAYFVEYYDKIKNIAFNKVNELADALTKMINMFKTVKDNDLNSTMNDFGTGLKSFASNVSSAFTKSFDYGNGYLIGKQFGSGFGSGMATGIKNAKFPTIAISSLVGNTTYANLKIDLLEKGGMPKEGNLFLMNENAPELLGTVGGKSFVANQEQMLGIIKDELATAKGMTNATFIIQVGDEQLGKYVINDLENKAKANGKPFTIGG